MGKQKFIIFIMGFFPILDCIPFFHMYSRVENKKYKKLGWTSVIINIICIVAVIVTMVCTVQFFYFDRLGLREYQDTQPKLEEYLGYNYFEKYTYDEYTSMEEYSEYRKDLDKWQNSSEVKNASRHADNIEMTWTYAFAGIVILYVIAIVIFLIKAFMERPKYLRELAKIYSASDVAKRLKSIKPDFSNVAKNKNETEPNLNIGGQKTKIDINSASEEELSDLQGLTIVDAKKLISYRNEHNGFNNVDEFFNCINAKPHIIVALEKQLTVGEYKTVKITKSDNSAKRMLDL